MAIPRYRGYGFRNIGGWEVRDNCAKAGRNLNIASSGVLLYLLSGANIESLSIGGASVTATHSSALLAFGLLTFIWLGYRFLLAYRDAADTDPWWHLYMRDILLQRYPVSSYITEELVSRFVPNATNYTLHTENSAVKSFGLLSGSVVVSGVNINGMEVATGVEIEIPKTKVLRAHLYCFPRYLLSNSDIADMWVPWMLYALAVAALIVNSIGIDVAGLFGILPPKNGG